MEKGPFVKEIHSPLRSPLPREELFPVHLCHGTLMSSWVSEQHFVVGLSDVRFFL